MKECLICGEQFEMHTAYANHVRWKHKQASFSENGRQKLVDNMKKINLARKEKIIEEKGEWITEERTCLKCGKIFPFKRRSKTDSKPFCSRSCANSRVFNSIQKKHHSNGIKKAWKENLKYIEKQVSSKVKHHIFSSKEERSILEKLKISFPENEWTSGGALRIENVIIARDIYSNILKICIEYDGIWHFKDIHGQLENKQKKDLILNNWCKDNGWKIIRISESFWHDNNKDFSFIINAIKQNETVFLGKEYSTRK